jgi:long-chain acyl-CoA synthetase
MADPRFVRPYGEYHPPIDGFPATVAELVYHRRERWPDEPFLKGRYGESEEIRVFSGAEFTKRALAINARLRELGLGKGDRVGLLSRNQPGWPLAYCGIILSGIVVVPIDQLLTPTEYGAVIAKSGIEALICEGKIYEDVAGRREEFPKLEHLINLDDWELVDPAAEVDEAEPPDDKPQPEDELAILFTSGTTGSSKVVRLLHRNVAFNVKQLHYAMYTGPQDNFLSVLPLFHTFECTCGFFNQLHSGSTILYAQRLNSRDLLRDMREGGITMMLGVPLLFEKLYKGLRAKLKQLPFFKRLVIGLLYGLEGFGRLFGGRWGKGLFRSLREKAGLSAVRAFVSGAAALSPEVARGFERLGILCFMGYGLTECSPTTNLNYNGERLEAPESVGPIFYAAEMYLDSPNELGEGEICIRGPQVTPGYLANDLANREGFFAMETPPEHEHRLGMRLLYSAGDGLAEVKAAHPEWYARWFRTGDIGWIGADGRLRISGRLKNVIVTAAGKNVYPEELEDYFADNPLLEEYIVGGRRLPEGNREDVVLLALPDWEYVKERAAAQGVGADEAYARSLIEAEIQRVNDKLASYKYIKDLYLRTEPFPRTSTGKIRRFLVGLEEGGE